MTSSMNTMEPSSKRRRLAPKVPELPAVSALPPTPQIQPLPAPHAFPQDQVNSLSYHSPIAVLSMILTFTYRYRHSTTHMLKLLHDCQNATSLKHLPATFKMPRYTSNSRLFDPSMLVYRF